MPLMTDTIPQFFNGVSQQAPNLRRVSQVEDQINCVSSITEGVLPRPQTNHLAKVFDGLIGNAFIHTINRDTDERFIVILKDEEIVVYDLEGNEMTVTYPAGTDYLSSVSPRQDFEAYTVKDYTFIVNKTIITAENTVTPAGVLTGTVQQFSDLATAHAAAAANTYFKIEGDAGSAFDSYYVEKTQENTGTASDVYTEVADPRLTSDNFDEATMPHQLVRTGPTTFEFQVIPWVARAAGDAVSNPHPSFTGNTISDLFIYRNRFGFLSGDNVILSESGANNFFNFFRTTVTQLLDSDPIDVSANNTRVADLKYAVPFTDSLLLFSEQTQFEMGSDDILTPKTVEISPTTEFVASMKARPVLAGRNVYFAVERTEYTGLREYFVDVDNKGNDAADITKHVPRYIPKNVFKIVPSSNEDTLFVLTDEEIDAIYVYQWFWAQTGQGLDKLQSAHHKWKLGEGASILNIDLIDNTLFVLVERDGETFLESIDLTTSKKDAGLNYQVRLDRRLELTGSYSAGTGLTTWTLPFETDEDAVVVRGAEFSENTGLQVLNTSQPTPSTVVATGDHSEDSCFIGFEYYKGFTLSPIYIRSASQGGTPIARLGGRLQLRNIKFFYNDSSLFKVDVTPKARDTYTRQFTPAIGSNESVIGMSIPQDGVFSVSVMSKADTTLITIYSTSFLPFAITSAEWEGFYHSSAVAR